MRMRVFQAVAVVACGVAGIGIGVARAADLPVERSTIGSMYYSAHGERAGRIVIYQHGPGTAMRAYWRAPWRHRHYFPATGEKPEIGRYEDFSEREAPEPAQSYHRYWSTSSAFLPELPRERDIVPPLK